MNIERDILAYLHLVTSREGESKLGEGLITLDHHQPRPGDWVILGVEEDIGPRANMGRGGAHTGFHAFASAFLNIQQQEGLSMDRLVWGGSIRVESDTQNVDALRSEVEALDGYLRDVLGPIFASGASVVLVGGGHNNALPLLQSLADEHCAVLNVDPHADFRAQEGRHSGNSFSYAMQQRVLGHYSVLGLHRNYNSTAMVESMRAQGDVYWTWYEDYLSNGPDRILGDVKAFMGDHCHARSVGLEFDVDGIADMPSSASTPSGWSPEMARRIMMEYGRCGNCRYLHLPEAAPQPHAEDMRWAGKLLSYLVSDFLREHLSSSR